MSRLKYLLLVGTAGLGLIATLFFSRPTRSTRASADGPHVDEQTDSPKARQSLTHRQGHPLQLPDTTPPLRVLYAIAMFDFHKWTHTDRILQNALEMCEAQMNVTVQIYTTAGPPDPVLVASLSSRFWCFSADAALPVHFFNHPESAGLNLVDFHRSRFYAELDSHDIFIYGEDDMSITSNTVRAFLYGLRLLHGTDMIPGFIRFEYMACDGSGGKWEPGSCERVYWEHTSDLEKAKAKIVHVNGNAYWQPALPYQAAYIFTRAQLADLNERCDFANDFTAPSSYPHAHREFIAMQAFGAHESVRTRCPYSLVVPIENAEVSAIHHLPDANHKRPGRGKAPVAKARETLVHLKKTTPVANRTNLPANPI